MDADINTNSEDRSENKQLHNMLAKSIQPSP